jgi:hypothetical protein
MLVITDTSPQVVTYRFGRFIMPPQWLVTSLPAGRQTLPVHLPTA